MLQKEQLHIQNDKNAQTEEMLNILELNKQCMTAILSSIFTIEKELFAISDILAGQVSE